MNLLVLLLVLPVLGAVASYFSGKKYARLVALVTSLVTVVLSLLAYYLFNSDFRGMQFFLNADWIPSIKIFFTLGVDGISLPMLILTTVLTLVSVLVSKMEIHDKEEYFYPILLLLETSLLGVFMALDLFLFYIFWEVVLVFMFFLIMFWGGENKRYAAIKFVIYTHVASLVMLVGIIALFLKGGTFSILELTALKFPLAFQSIVFLALLLGFLVKMPVFPFHTWLPDAHVEAPTAGSILLAGVLLKMGSYGLLRIGIGVLPDAAAKFAPFLIGLAIVSIIYGALASLAQSNIKRLVAYSSVNHMGYVLLGLSSLTAIGTVGASFEMVSHGLITGLLFALCGIIHHKTDTFDIETLKGLLKPMPKLAWLFILGALGSLGLPSMSGFVAEFLVFVGTYQAIGAYVLLPLIGVVVTAGMFIWLLQRSFFGKPTAQLLRLTDTDVPITGYVILVVLMFLLGLLPALLVNVFKASYLI